MFYFIPGRRLERMLREEKRRNRLTRLKRVLLEDT